MSKKDEETTEKTSGSTMVDAMSPYFISGSDNPNIVFSSDLLRDDNYADWADEISNALYAKNKYGFVDGSIPIPDEGSSEWSLWKRCNAMIRGWLQTSMNKEIRASVKHAKTAQEIWEDLRERFGSASAPRAFELKREITLTRQEKCSVSAYYTKLKGLWDEFQATSPVPKCKCRKCSCDIGKQLMELRDKERLYEFLLGLDETFSTVRTQILSTRPMVSLGTAFHIVSEDERQKQITSAVRTNIDAVAFKSESRHETWDRRDNQREAKKCTHCGKLYHTINECYELVGYPKPGEKGCRENKKKEEPWKKKITKEAHMANTNSQVPGIPPDKFQECWNYFSNQTKNAKAATDKGELSSVNMAGLTFEDADWDG